MIFQQEQKKELMLLKHKLDLERLSKKDAGDPKAVEAEGMVSYSQESTPMMKTKKSDFVRNLHQ